jgi:squalene cyclase
MVTAANWIIDQQIFKPGDWQVKNPELSPEGGHLSLLMIGTRC